MRSTSARYTPTAVDLVYVWAQKAPATTLVAGAGSSVSLALVVVVSVQPGDAAGAPPSWASGSDPPPPLLSCGFFGACGQAAEPIPGGLAIVAVVVDEDAGTSGPTA